MPEFESLNRRIVACKSCPRLRAWCEQVAKEKRRAFVDQHYWGKPVPNFGDSNAQGLIIGLAPAAHGANRTGRMFTGDRSGDWLYRALFRAGLATQAESTSADDGLELRGVAITAVAHCAPPANKPASDEIAHCQRHLMDTLALREWRAILCLGGIAWGELHRALGVAPRPKFAHGATSRHDDTTIIGSYHPSQQNTFTGRLTEKMFDDVIQQFARTIG